MIENKMSIGNNLGSMDWLDQYCRLERIDACLFRREIDRIKWRDRVKCYKGIREAIGKIFNIKLIEKRKNKEFQNSKIDST